MLRLPAEWHLVSHRWGEPSCKAQRQYLFSLRYDLIKFRFIRLLASQWEDPMNRLSDRVFVYTTGDRRFLKMSQASTSLPAFSGKVL
jgi:hypothetical protein